ncbi:hypothetical protein NG819_01885 [Pseudarthrobacter sp. Fe7]|nr:hypothetical protein NG819_01885 [Pseudarthrobacter sp. Fe7]
MKRRSIVKYAAVAAAMSLGLTACGGGGGGSDQAKQSGTVRVTLANHVWTEGIKAAIPEFEKSSGLKVELTQARRGPAIRPVQRQAQRRQR